MTNIFIGLLLIFIDFKINIGSVSIGLIPDFLGYIFLLKGISEMVYYSKRFKKIEAPARGMFIYTLIIYILDLSTITHRIGRLSILFGMVGVGISLYILYEIIVCLHEIELSNQYNLNSIGLMKLWRIFVVAYIVSYLLQLLPSFFIVIAYVLMIAVTAIFLYSFYNSKKLFDLMPGKKDIINQK